MKYLHDELSVLLVRIDRHFTLTIKKHLEKKYVLQHWLALFIYAFSLCRILHLVWMIWFDISYGRENCYLVHTVWVGSNFLLLYLLLCLSFHNHLQFIIFLQPVVMAQYLSHFMSNINKRRLIHSKVNG